MIALLKHFLYGCSQANADNRESLAAMGIYPYPTIEEVKDCKFPKEWLSVKPISPEDIVDMNEMTKYLLLLVEHPELRDELGRNARRIAQERYDWKVIIKRYEELWKELYEQAQSFNGSPEERLVLRPNRLATFRGYPSSIVDLDTRVHTTSYGNEVLNKKKSLKYYSGMKNVLLFPVIQDILKMALDEKPIGEIEQELLLKYRSYSLTPQDVRYQVMWLLKHGLLKVS